MRKKVTFLVLVIFAFSCKLPQMPAAAPDVSALPASYAGETPMANSAELDMKMFFVSPQLRALLDTVVKHNYDLKIAMQRMEWAKAHSRQAAGLLYPQLQAGAVPSLRRFGLYTMDGAGNISTDIETGKTVPVNLPDLYLGLQTSWEIDLWGKLKNRKKAALARLLASAEGKNFVLTNLVAETAAAYFDLLAEDEILRVLDQTIVLQEQATELVRVQKQAAVVNELAVQQFEAQLLSMRNMRVDVQQRIINAEVRINMLAGRFSNPIPRDSGFYALNALPRVSEGVPSQLLTNRPDIRQAEAELVAAHADLKAARAAFLPALNITGSLGVQAYRPALLFTLPESIAYGLFAGITGPLLNRANIKGEFGKASAMQQEAVFNYQKQLNRAFLEVYRDMRMMTSLEEMYEMKLQETSILASSVQVSSDLFRTGRANYLEVLIARQNTLRSNMELIHTRRNQFLTAVNLYKSLGGGWR